METLNNYILMDSSSTFTFLHYFHIITQLHFYSNNHLYIYIITSFTIHYLYYHLIWIHYIFINVPSFYSNSLYPFTIYSIIYYYYHSPLTTTMYSYLYIILSYSILDSRNYPLYPYTITTIIHSYSLLLVTS